MNDNNRNQQALPIAVSPDDAARISGVGRTTIYQALGSGALRSSKIGKRRLITVEALKGWIEANSEPIDAR